MKEYFFIGALILGLFGVGEYMTHENQQQEKVEYKNAVKVVQGFQHHHVLAYKDSTLEGSGTPLLVDTVVLTSRQNAQGYCKGYVRVHDNHSPFSFRINGYFYFRRGQEILNGFISGFGQAHVWLSRIRKVSHQ
ncbi:hypothetical protein [Persicobacter psychrovividus]|uniref:Uncharacterized protein n=1 Tax=Persicobacter psychrovividus TaxID=387638 RepID=A0ABM7VCY2_9BACT|nr:hypothetical protein PEPS_10810 [Persicobacter psychrovividus]